MSEQVIAALDLPAGTRVDRRIPKALLLEHGAPTATDKRCLNTGIEELQWVAVLKPTSVGVAAYRDEVREYLEIAVLRVALRPGAKQPRLIELLHRAVPYPVLAVTGLGERVNLSIAHKRWSQGDREKTVLDGEPVSVDVPPAGDPLGSAFAAALALGQQPQTSLLTLFDGWLDTLLALDVARLTGRLTILPTPEARIARRRALRECTRLEAEIAHLRAGAAKEKQMARQVDLNLALRRAQAARAAALAQL